MPRHDVEYRGGIADQSRSGTQTEHISLEIPKYKLVGPEPAFVCATHPVFSIMRATVGPSRHPVVVTDTTLPLPEAVSFPKLKVVVDGGVVGERNTSNGEGRSAHCCTGNVNPCEIVV